MFQFTKKTEYAIIALKHIASQSDGTFSSAREIADRYHLSFDLVSKIMQKLKREGYVESHQGILGGYSLSADLNKISLAQFVEAMDGPLGMIECARPSGQDNAGAQTCIQFNYCTIVGPMRRLNGRVKQVLKATTLGEIFSEVSDPLKEGQRPEITVLPAEAKAN